MPTGEDSTPRSHDISPAMSSSGLSGEGQSSANTGGDDTTGDKGLTPAGQRSYKGKPLADDKHAALLTVPGKTARGEDAGDITAQGAAATSNKSATARSEQDATTSKQAAATTSEQDATAIPEETRTTSEQDATTTSSNQDSATTSKQTAIATSKQDGGTTSEQDATTSEQAATTISEQAATATSEQAAMTSEQAATTFEQDATTTSNQVTPSTSEEAAEYHATLSLENSQAMVSVLNFFTDIQPESCLCALSEAKDKSQNEIVRELRYQARARLIHSMTVRNLAQSLEKANGPGSEKQKVAEYYSTVIATDYKEIKTIERLEEVTLNMHTSHEESQMEREESQTTDDHDDESPDEATTSCCALFNKR